MFTILLKKDPQALRATTRGARHAPVGAARAASAARTGRRGFTLVELLLAAGIGLLALATLSAVTTGGLRALRAAKRMDRLHANGSFMVDSMSYVVKQAKELTVPNPQVLNVRMPDDSVRTYGLAAGQLTLDGAPITGQDIQITQLAFTAFPRSVRVAFTLKPKLGNSGETFSATTTIAARNPFF